MDNDKIIEELREDLGLLEKQPNDFILNLVRKNPNKLTAIKVFNLIENFLSAGAKLQIKDIFWMTPFQSKSVDIPHISNSDNGYHFIMKVAIKTSEDIDFRSRAGGKTFTVEEGGRLYGIFAGVVDFENLKEGDIVEQVKDIFIRGLNFSKVKKEIDTEWEYLTRKIKKAKRFVNEIDKNRFLRQKIDALSELDEVDLLDDDSYLKLMEYVVELSGAEPTRVYGEYKQVARTTQEPVLMNKAMGIALNKKQATGLVYALSRKYRKQLEAVPRIRKKLNSNNGIIPIKFTTIMRGHADPNNIAIVLPKLGDWRMGMRELYSAELIFHEFAHVIDFGRKSHTRSSSFTSIHKEDFVNILDTILVDFKDWIDKHYDLQEHKKNILELSIRLSDFRQNKKQIVSDIAKREKEEREEELREKESKKEQLGLSEDTYPLNLVFKDNKDLLVNYVEWVITDKIKDASTTNEQRHLYANILEAVNTVSPTIHKDELDLLNKAVQEASRTKFVFNLPMKEQLKATKPIKEFESDIEKMKEDKFAKIEDDNKPIVEHYNEDLILDGQEEQMEKIIGKV